MPATKSINKQVKRQVKKAIVKKAVKKMIGPKNRSTTAMGPRVKGRGGYWSDFKDFFTKSRNGGASIANKGLSKLGGYIGESTGIPLAKEFGNNAGSFLSRALGMGKYQVKHNSLMTSAGVMGTNAPPSFGSVKQGSDIVFSHREFVADIASSQNFSSTTYAINAGNPRLLPWAHKVGILYEEAEFLGILMEYKTTSATAVGTTTSGMGVVLMATDYDCYDSNYSNKRAMEAAEFSSDGVPYESFIHPIECDPKRNVLARNYVVPGITQVTDAPGDARLSVMGNFTIATVGQQTTGDIIGELWITYHVRFSRPILEDEVTTTDAYSDWISGFISNTGVVSSIATKNNSSDPLTYAFLGTGSAATLTVSNASGRTGGYEIKVVATQTLAGSGTTAWQIPALATTSFTGGAQDILNYANTNKTTSYVASVGDLIGTIDPKNEMTASSFVYFNGAGTGLITIPLPFLGNTSAQCALNIHVTQWDNTIHSRKPPTTNGRRRVTMSETQCRENRDRWARDAYQRVNQPILPSIRDRILAVEQRVQAARQQAEDDHSVDCYDNSKDEVPEQMQLLQTGLIHNDLYDPDEAEFKRQMLKSQLMHNVHEKLRKPLKIIVEDEESSTSSSSSTSSTSTTNEGDNQVLLNTDYVPDLEADIEDAYDICDVILGRCNDAKNPSIQKLVALAGISNVCMQVPVIPDAYNLDSEEIKVKMKYLFNQYLDVYDTFRNELKIFTDMFDVRHVRNLKIVEQAYNDYIKFSSTLKKFNSV